MQKAWEPPQAFLSKSKTNQRRIILEIIQNSFS
jgi:hypothetical protein